MYRSILVPLDGSQFSEHALPLARAIACQAGAALHLVHVHMVRVPMSFDAIPVFDEVLDAQERAREQAYLDDLARRLSCDGMPSIATAVVDVPIGEAIHAYVAAHAIDLVVMTTHGRGAFSRFWLGSVADTLVRCAPVPVLLIRPRAEPPDMQQELAIKHILVPLDGSALSERILPPAAALGALTGAAFTLLHVLAFDALGYETDWPVAHSEAGALAAMRVDAQAYLDRVAERLGAQSLIAHTAVVGGLAASAVLEYAHDQRVDLIALATHGRSGAARMLLGSMADKILRGATTPILLYRPPKEAYQQVKGV